MGESEMMQGTGDAEKENEKKNRKRNKKRNEKQNEKQNEVQEKKREISVSLRKNEDQIITKFILFKVCFY